MVHAEFYYKFLVNLERGESMHFTSGPAWLDGFDVSHGSTKKVLFSSTSPSSHLGLHPRFTVSIEYGKRFYAVPPKYLSSESDRIKRGRTETFISEFRLEVTILQFAFSIFAYRIFWLESSFRVISRYFRQYSLRIFLHSIPNRWNWKIEKWTT